MFVSRKALAAILERLDRLETIVASATGYDKKELAKRVQPSAQGTRCPSVWGSHDFSDTTPVICRRCGGILGA